MIGLADRGKGSSSRDDLGGRYEEYIGGLLTTSRNLCNLRIEAGNLGERKVWGFWKLDFEATGCVNGQSNAARV